MKNLFLTLVLVYCASFGINAQNIQLFDYDYARFSIDDTSSYIEIYYVFYLNNFDTAAVSESRTVSGELSIVLENTVTGEMVVNKKYQFSDSVDSRILLGMLQYGLSVGEYKGTITGKDLQSEEHLQTEEFAFNVIESPDDRFKLSDIQLASTIRQDADQNSMFYKNTFEIVPNPSRFYGEKFPVIFFYSEFYGIDIDVESEELKVEHILMNADDKVVYKKSKSIPRKNSNIVDVGAINVSKQPTGAYTLYVTVSDTVRDITAAIPKRVFIFNPSIVDTTQGVSTDTDFFASEFASMSEEEVEYTYEVSKFIATESEIDKWENLEDIEARKNFLFTFWLNRDEVPETPINETKRAYFSRVDRANQMYSSVMDKSGWKTDRGRVLIMYGEPSEIERYPSMLDTKPYEMWRYDEIEGGVVFIFADISGFDSYQLIHSTKRGELRDDDWQRRIETF